MKERKCGVEEVKQSECGGSGGSGVWSVECGVEEVKGVTLLSMSRELTQTKRELIKKRANFQNCLEGGSKDSQTQRHSPSRHLECGVWSVEWRK